MSAKINLIKGSFLVVFSAALISFVGDGSETPEENNSSKKPNIVIIYLDDLGFGDVGAYGAIEIKTPNLDKLATGGAMFTDGHSSSATCTPSRYAILTGIYPWRNKDAHILPGSAPLIIDTVQQTIPKMLKAQGYHTGLVGKWHLGLGSGALDWNQRVSPGPNEVGFDYAYYMAATQDRVPTVYIENGMVQEFNPTSLELKEATSFWNEFEEYRADKEPGEEYELIEHWGKDLNLNRYFELMFENDYHNRPKNLDEFMDSMAEDPYGLNVDTQLKGQQNDEFLKSQAKIGTNMAVTMFMVDALRYFENISSPEIKKIAMDIAMLGTQGFNPDKDGYRVPSIAGKTFSGYHILAYYYVSWMLAIPESVKQLELPFDEEYKLARTMYEGSE